MAIPEEYQKRENLYQALKVLRLIHVKELREMQDQVSLRQKDLQF